MLTWMADGGWRLKQGLEPRRRRRVWERARASRGQRGDGDVGVRLAMRLYSAHGLSVIKITPHPPPVEMRPDVWCLSSLRLWRWRPHAMWLRARKCAPDRHTHSLYVCISACRGRETKRGGVPSVCVLYYTLFIMRMTRRKLRVIVLRAWQKRECRSCGGPNENTHHSHFRPSPLSALAGELMAKPPVTTTTIISPAVSRRTWSGPSDPNQRPKRYSVEAA